MSKLSSILFFQHSQSQYGVLPRFTEDLVNALVLEGVDCKLIDFSDMDFHDLCYEIMSNPPDCTMAFNGILPGSTGNFMADSLKVPHVALIVDHPNHFLPLAKSNYTIIATVDQNSCDTWRTCGSNHVLFLPHAIGRKLVEVDEEQLLQSTRSFDIVMPASYIEFAEIESKWDKKFSLALCQQLKEVANKVLESATIDHIQALLDLIQHNLEVKKELDPYKTDLSELMTELEYYIRAKDRLEIVSRLRDFKVHIFGAGTQEGWQKIAKLNPHITIHPSVPFDQLGELFKASKVVVNSSPTIKKGLHERLLMSLACGASVLTNHSIFLRHQFAEEEGVIGYRPCNYEKLEGSVQRLLSDESQRIKSALGGRSKVRLLHTWDQRAKLLASQVPDLIDTIRTNLVTVK